MDTKTNKISEAARKRDSSLTPEQKEQRVQRMLSGQRAWRERVRAALEMMESKEETS